MTNPSAGGTPSAGGIPLVPPHNTAYGIDATNDERHRWSRGLRLWALIAAGASLASLVIFSVLGPAGKSAWQFTPLASVALTVLFGVSMTVLVLTGLGIAQQMLGGRSNWWVDTALLLAGVVLFLLWEAAVAFACFVMLWEGEGSVGTVTINGVGYYERDEGYLEHNFKYFAAHGPIFMDRSGMETGERRFGDEASDQPRPVLTPANSPDSEVSAPPEEALEPHGSPHPSHAPIDVDSETILAMGESDGVVLGIAELETSLGGRGVYRAVASVDDGMTWETRGEAGADVSFNSYFVVDASVQVIGFGTASSDASPPAAITRDGGWTWHPLRANASRRFVPRGAVCGFCSA